MLNLPRLAVRPPSPPPSASPPRKKDVCVLMGGVGTVCSDDDTMRPDNPVKLYFEKLVEAMKATGRPFQDEMMLRRKLEK